MRRDARPRTITFGRKTRMRRRMTADAVRRQTYPHPYPDGWYRITRSSTLRAGEVCYFECLGRQLVAWRGEDGEAHVSSAFCPHLGANLAFGRVREDCLECPFHRWQFTGDGRVAHIPYSDQRPAGTLIEMLPVAEVYGQLFLYHRGGGRQRSAAEAPPYPVPRIAEVDDGTFVYRGHHDGGRVRMHLLEFAENAVDRAHFEPLHGQMRIPWTRLGIPGVGIDHAARWELDPDLPWKMHFFDDAVLRVFGRRVESSGASAHITFYGPGIAKFRFTLPGRGDIEMYQTHLPLGAMEQHVHFEWFAHRRLPRLLVWYVVGNWITQWQQDIEIWENKIHQPRPQLCRDDGPVFRLRKWYEQFVPEDA